MSYWIKNLEYAFASLVDQVKKSVSPISFFDFSDYVIENSDRSQSTKENMRGTLKKLKSTGMNYIFVILTLLFCDHLNSV